MTSVVRYDAPARAWVELLAPAAELAKTISSTDFVPRALRDNAAAITACILYGAEIGVGPMQSLAKIHVIDGRPFVAAEVQRGLVYAAGHELWIDEATNQRVTWAGRRRGVDAVTRITWTLDDARKAQIGEKQNWKRYPRAMLTARASGEICRALFADVIGGLGTLEEYDDTFGTDLGGAPSSPQTASAAQDGTSTRRRRPKLAVAPEPETAVQPLAADRATELPPLPNEVEDEAPDMREAGLTDAQRRRIMATFNAKGVTGAGSRKARLQKMREWTGRTGIDSGNDLTYAEAKTVIERLDEWEGPADVERQAVEVDVARAVDDLGARPLLPDEVDDRQVGPDIPRDVQ